MKFCSLLNCHAESVDITAWTEIDEGTEIIAI